MMYVLKKAAIVCSNTLTGKWIILLTMSMVLLISQAKAQPEFNYAGKHFFYSYPYGWVILNPYYFPRLNHIGISSKHLAHVKIHFHNTQFGNPAVVNLLVNPGEVVKFAPDYKQITAMSDSMLNTVNNRSIEIESDSNIIVHFVNKAPYSDDGTQLLPVDNQPPARNFTLINYDPYNPVFNSYGSCYYELISTCDSTLVRITPTANLFDTHNSIPNNPSHLANVPYTIMLHKGETYRIFGPGPLTHTTVEVLSAKANVPLCVYTANSNMVPEVLTNNGMCCADLMLEQLLPIEWWDTLAPVSLFNWNTKARLRVMTATNNTKVWFDNTLVGTINIGSLIDTLIDRSVVVHADHPVAIIEFMVSNWTTTSPNRGDPDMHWKMSPRQGIRESYFQFFGPRYPAGPPTETHNAVTVISKASNVSNILFDGNSIASLFQPFPGDPSWMYAHVHIDSSDTTITHHIISPEKILGFVNKAYITGGYSYNLCDLSIDSLHIPLVTQSDTVYKCRGVTATLNAPFSNPVRQWSTGDTTKKITVKDPGTYSVQALDAQACITQRLQQTYYVIDTFDTMQVAYAIDSVVKCSNRDILLQASPALGWYWNTGDTTACIIAKDTGLYTVQEILTIDTCKMTYKLHDFYVQNAFFSFDLYKDTTICEGDTIWLKSGYPATFWSTGDTGVAIRVHDKGVYNAYIVDTCGIQHQGAIILRHKVCEEKYCNSIVFPDVFTPNNDGLNDLFRLLKKGELTSYYLTIFNRWGQEVFRTYDINEGWNGTFNGQPAESATYMFMCMYSCPGSGSKILKGDVTLVR